MKYKLNSFSHQELNTPKDRKDETIKQNIESCRNVNIDSTYPKYVIENIEYFKNIGFIEGD